MEGLFGGSHGDTKRMASRLRAVFVVPFALPVKYRVTILPHIEDIHSAVSQGFSSPGFPLKSIASVTRLL